MAVRLIAFIACLCAALTVFTASANAAELRSISIDEQQYYIEVTLDFDRRPGYTESFRFDPDRYLLTLEGCSLKAPIEQTDALEEIRNSLLTRISTYEGSGNLALGFYLNHHQQPMIKYFDNRYFVRFYTAQRNEHNYQLATGVSYSQRSSTYRGENFDLHIVRIDPGAAQVYSAAADRYDGKTRRRAPSSFGRREDALVVINGGFFGRSGEHLSTLVEEGVIRATGVYPTRPMLVVRSDGGIEIGRYNVETSLAYGQGKRITISAKNYPFESGKVVVYDHLYPIDTLPQEGMYYYLIEDGRMRYYSYSTSGLWLSPEMKLIASDIIPEANPLRDVPDGTAVSLDTRITDSEGNTVNAISAIGGAPMLVEEGGMSITIAEDKVRADISRSERSRTAVGLTRSGTLILAVVREAEDQGYGGVTLEALSEIMLDEGAYTAMNLDGGGSSAMVVAGMLLNLSEKEERPVSNVLIVREWQGTAASSQTPPSIAVPVN